MDMPEVEPLIEGVAGGGKEQALRIVLQAD